MSAPLALCTYPYEPHATRYTLSRDGEAILTGSEQACWDYLHATHACSVWHALKFEGYDMQAVPER